MDNSEKHMSGGQGRIIRAFPRWNTRPRSWLSSGYAASSGKALLSIIRCRTANRSRCAGEAPAKPQRFRDIGSSVRTATRSSVVFKDVVTNTCAGAITSRHAWIEPGRPMSAHCCGRVHS